MQVQVQVAVGGIQGRLLPLVLREQAASSPLTLCLGWGQALQRCSQHGPASMVIPLPVTWPQPPTHAALSMHCSPGPVTANPASSMGRQVLSTKSSTGSSGFGSSKRLADYASDVPGPGEKGGSLAEELGVGRTARFESVHTRRGGAGGLLFPSAVHCFDCSGGTENVASVPFATASAGSATCPWFTLSSHLSP